MNLPIAAEGGLTPESSAVARLIGEALGGRLRELGVDGLRAFVEARRPRRLPSLHAVVAQEVPTRHGSSAVRVYRPGPDSLGTVMYMHGGGWVAGGLDGHDDVCRVLADRSGATVVSVDYPLSPEHRHPVAVEACADVLTWIESGPDVLARRPGSGVVLAGDSAGASIAAVLAAAGSPSLMGQLLVYPVCEYLPIGAEGPPSWRGCSGPLLDADDVEWFFEHHLDGDPASVQLPSTVAWSRVPSTLVVLAGQDPLRDSGRSLATALRSTGADVQVREWPGTFHGFFPMVDALEDAREALTCASDFIASVLAH